MDLGLKLRHCDVGADVSAGLLTTGLRPTLTTYFVKTFKIMIMWYLQYKCKSIKMTISDMIKVASVQTMACVS